MAIRPLDHHTLPTNDTDTSWVQHSLSSRQGIQEPPPTFLTGPFGSGPRARPWPQDVRQPSETENCWTLAILKVLAQSHPEHIMDMFVKKDGEYVQVVLPAGCWDIDLPYLQHNYKGTIAEGKWWVILPPIELILRWAAAIQEALKKLHPEVKFCEAAGVGSVCYQEG